MKTRPGYPTLQNTNLGWILSGEYPQLNEDRDKRQEPKSLFVTSDHSLGHQMQRFWTLEEINHITYSPEHRKCEKHFKDTTVRDDDGRYIVELPLKNEINLGNSKEIALQRFHFLEKKLQACPRLCTEYVGFMRECEKLGHMFEVHSNSTLREPEYYIPHHAVHKHSSSTTKTRVVFYASAKTDNGVSLNNIGPTDELKTYALTTVTYGISSAAYLATRCLQQLAIDEATRFPRAASVLQHDFYVDDCISGADTLEEALKLRIELQNLLQLGGFPLRKWCTNSLELLESIPKNLREYKHALTGSDSNIVKTLSSNWLPSTDQFRINCDLNSNARESTTQNIFTQRLWQEGSGWDDQLSGNLLDTWNELYQQIPALNHLQIPRLVLSEGTVKNIERHGFSDASQTAYGASVYVRSVNREGKTLTRLLCAKSRVAPLKQFSIQRLELCGALTLASLIKKILSAIRITPDCIRLWTDSEIVLPWLHACRKQGSRVSRHCTSFTLVPCKVTGQSR
ncbi:hypothetical protein ANN_09484 [Periplaneta americana]|uniref:Uncharacterized protein n=1 Tax=Periplaneta americana TaxID=6978 RepID=A0ABQ8TLT9_PERAM|nr:hypothetical protein ANN_09484 [Periplaneta americana]